MHLSYTNTGTNMNNFILKVSNKNKNKYLCNVLFKCK